MEIEVVLDAGATIGESPTWASAEKALYWIDVKKPALYRYDPATGGQRSWPMPSDIGAFGLVSDPPGAVVALRQGIFRLDFASGSLTQLAPPPFDPALFRFNEGACDAAGRFWVGVMFDPLDDAVPPQKSSLHSFTLREGLRTEPDAAELHNGMAWSPDGRRFYLSHSYQARGVRLCVRPGKRPARRARSLRTDPGSPWSARWRGRRLPRRILVRVARRQPVAAVYRDGRGGPGHRAAGEPADHVRLRGRGTRRAIRDNRLRQAQPGAAAARAARWRAAAPSARREGHRPALHAALISKLHQVWRGVLTGACTIWPLLISR